MSHSVRPQLVAVNFTLLGLVGIVGQTCQPHINSAPIMATHPIQVPFELPCSHLHSSTAYQPPANWASFRDYCEDADPSEFFYRHPA